MARFRAKIERRFGMQQLIDLLNQISNLTSIINGMPLEIASILCALITVFAMIIVIGSSYKGQHKVAEIIAIVGTLVTISTIGSYLFEEYTRQAKIKANNVKIEQIEKSVIDSQSSKYPFCVSMEENSFINSNRTLVFFHNKQDAITFVQKNKNDKNIFVTNYLKSHDSTFLERGSNQAIENDFDCMQVEHTKKALTQMINSIEQNDN